MSNKTQRQLETESRKKEKEEEGQAAHERKEEEMKYLEVPKKERANKRR